VAVAVGVGEGVPLGVGLTTAATVVTVTLHPPAKVPWSPGPSSNTYKDHVPFGAEPMKSDKAIEYGEAGAGAGNVVAGG
jgi:hypothetical protein